MRKKIFLLFITLIIATSFTTTIQPASTAATSTFKDVANTHWALDSIEWAVSQGIVSGYSDGTFKPGQAVKEPEFLTMLFRAYPNISIPELLDKEPWYKPYFSLAISYNWPVWYETDSARYNRGRVAQVLAATQGNLLDTNKSVQYLLDHDLASGKTSATVAGFGIEDKLTRAEAITLIKNMKGRGFTLSKAIGKIEEPVKIGFQIQGISIGDSEASVVAKYGQPVSKEASEYGFEWYVYHQDYNNYMQVGLKNGAVVGLYSNSAEWSSKEGVTLGSTSATVKKAYGEPLSEIKKGNTRYLINKKDMSQSPVYLVDNSYVTFFLDVHKQDTVTAIQLIEQKTEQSFQSYYAKPSETLSASFERQVFNLANATRVRFGLKALSWDDKAASTARKHSKDMSDSRFFDHVNLLGKDPFDRMEDNGIRYLYASENIAAGQTSSIFAHEAWMNSMDGHREAILSEEAARLGVGVYLGEGQYHYYYTQNYYTPR